MQEMTLEITNREIPSESFKSGWAGRRRSTTAVVIPESEARFHDDVADRTRVVAERERAGSENEDHIRYFTL